MKPALYLMILVLLVSSCEKSATVNVPREPSKIVMNSILNTNSVFSVTVGKSAYILDNNPDYQLNTAFLQLLVNDVVKDTLIYNSGTNTYNAKNFTRALTGNNYIIKGIAAGFEPVEAATYTPGIITIQNISRRQNVRTDMNGARYDEIKFSFRDNNATEDYYLVKLKRPFDASGQYDPVYCFKSSDKDIDRSAGNDPTDFENCIDNEFLMSDRNFNGALKELVLFVSHDDMQSYTNGIKTFKPVIELHHITKDHYRYRKSFTTYQDAEDNPFAEPVLVYGNVKKGFGIISIFSLSRDTIR